MKGFDLLLNRIKEQPTKTTLKLRYLALVADLESVEEKISTVLKLAEFYRSGFPKEALEMAYLICRYDNANIRAIEIIIEVLQLQGKETQAKVMSEYLSKIRRNLEVSNSEMLKQIKYAASESAPEKENASGQNPSLTSSSVWGSSEETSKVMAASSDPNLNAKKENSSKSVEGQEILNEPQKVISGDQTLLQGDSTVIVSQPSELRTIDLNFPENFSEADGKKTEIVTMEVIEVKSSIQVSGEELKSQRSFPEKDSMNLGLMGFEDLEIKGPAETLNLSDDLGLGQDAVNEVKTELSRDSRQLDFKPLSNSIENTEIMLPSSILPAGGMTDSYRDEKAHPGKKKMEKGIRLELENFLERSEGKQSSSEMLRGFGEPRISLEFGEKILHSNQPQQSEFHPIIAIGDNQKFATDYEPKPIVTLSEFEDETPHSSDKTEVSIANSNTSQQNFPLEINPFDGKLPGKLHAGQTESLQKSDTIKLVIGRIVDSLSPESEKTQPSMARLDYQGAAQNRTLNSPNLADNGSNQTDLKSNHQVKKIVSDADSEIYNENHSTPNSQSHAAIQMSHLNVKNPELNHSQSDLQSSQNVANQNRVSSSKSFQTNTFQKNTFQTNTFQTNTSQTNSSDTSPSSSKDENSKDLMIDSKGTLDKRNGAIEGSDSTRLSEAIEKQDNTFAFTANEIPQLSGNKIFSSQHSGIDQGSVILRLQNDSGMNEIESNSHFHESPAGESNVFFESSNFQAEKKLGSTPYDLSDQHQSLDLSKKLEELIAGKKYREALELLRNTAENFSRSIWWKKGFETIERSGFLGSNTPNQFRSLQSHEIQALAFRLLEETKSLAAPHEYLREFFMKATSVVDREKIFDFFFHEPLPGMELLQIDVYMALGASLEAAQLVRDRLQDNFRDIDGLVRRARMIWHSLGWQAFSWRPEDGDKKLLAILSQRPRQRPSADLL